ncbi:A24 family peptidase [Parvularcula marina]|uniref:prepilin peptidase n=1 Tax=Parvularcula marina TaxID=2292771 RepID=UPI003512A218
MTGVILLIGFTGLGLLLGSFLGVVIHRGPQIWGLAENEGEEQSLSLAWPPSHCPSCKTRLRPVELIPILGYLFARGRCRHCETPIPRFYPIVESLGLLAGLISALLFASPVMAGAALTFFLLLIAMAAIDARTGYLPDALTLPLLTLGLGAGAFGVFVTAQDAILGWVIGWGCLAALAALYRLLRGREGLGGGDAKLLGAGAAFTGPYALPIMLALAASSALIGAFFMGKGRIDGATEIRFGPWLAGAIAAVFILQRIWPALPL